MILNLFDQELQVINTKPMIKNKLKELLSDLKKFKIQRKLVLELKKRDDCNIFHLYSKLTASTIQNLMKHLNPYIKVLS